MKTLFSHLFLILCTPFLMAQQYAPIEDVEMLEKFDQVLRKQASPIPDKLTIDKAVKVDDKHSLVYYQNGGEKFEALLNSARKEMLMVAVFKHIEKADVPKIVLDKAKEEHSGWKMNAFYKVQEPHTSVYYAINISKSGENKKVYFDELGHYEKAPY